MKKNLKGYEKNMKIDKIEFFRNYGDLTNDSVVTDIYKKRIAERKKKNARNKFHRRNRRTNKRT